MGGQSSCNPRCPRRGSAGYSVVNAVHCRHELNDEPWCEVMEAFAEQFPTLKTIAREGTMDFKLVDQGWGELINCAMKRDSTRIRIICPFIKAGAAKRLMSQKCAAQFEVITRFDLNGFYAGVSDTAALQELLKAGATIRGVKNLHAKVYLIGKQYAIVTSANLTEQALSRNHEFGFATKDSSIVEECHSYFEKLWKNAGSDLTPVTIDEWNSKVKGAQTSVANGQKAPRLPDEGTDLGFSSEAAAEPNLVNTAEQGFVKFFGLGNDRVSSSIKVIDEVNSSTSHWALSYPATKRPRNVKDGALMFMSRLVDSNDILIYGRGIGMAYRPGRDDATPGDIKKRDWKAHWSRYIRVRDVEFVNGALAECVSLNDLMTKLGPSSFVSTKERYQRGERNIRLRATYARKAQVQLTPEAIAWLNDQLDRCFEQHGKISQEALSDLAQSAK